MEVSDHVPVVMKVNWSRGAWMTTYVQTGKLWVKWNNIQYYISKQGDDFLRNRYLLQYTQAPESPICRCRRRMTSPDRQQWSIIRIRPRTQVPTCFGMVQSVLMHAWSGKPFYMSYLLIIRLIGRPVARLFCGGGQMGQILGPFMITRGLSCDRVGFGHFGGGGGRWPPWPPPGYGPDRFIYFKHAWTEMHNTGLIAYSQTKVKEFFSYIEILEVNLFAFAYKLFHEDFSPVYESHKLETNLQETACGQIQIN